MGVPESVADINDAWLSRALGRPASIRGTERIGEGYGLASEVFRIELEGFRAESVVVKLWPVDSPAGTTEIHFYNELAPGLDGVVPPCHHAAADAARGVLVMDDLVGRQGDVLVPESAESLQGLIAVLGNLHSTWWGDASLGTLAWLRDGRQPPQTADWIESRTARFIERFGSPQSEPATSLIRQAGAALSHGTGYLSELPPTLVHGDLHLDNILFVDEQPVVLDWAGCRRGPAAQDLAAVLFGMGEPDQADPLLGTYRASLASKGVDLDRAVLERAVGGAVLWSFVYWTLGTAMWTPTDDRSAAMQKRHIRDAVRMVTFWAKRDPALFEQVVQ